MRIDYTDFTKQYISEAVLQLMEEKDFHEISITEIAKKAGVGRATFYRNFNSKEDVLIYHFNNVVEELNSQTRFIPRCDDDYYDTILSILRTMEKNKNMVQLIIKSHLETLLLNYLNEQYLSVFEDAGKPNNTLLPYFYSGAIYNITIQWVKDDCTEPIEKVAETLFLASFGEKNYKELIERMK
ncbi:MAG: TetR/AcrR family transcriptional regulator [Clostridia bacterium]|nr:TetR/AcrR family transcriptional regulator [Clostridia bacterium]